MSKLSFFVPSDVENEKECPKCGQKGTLRISRPKDLIDNLVVSFSLHRRFRCKSCNWKGYLFSHTISRDWYKIVIFYIFLMIVVVALVAVIAKKFI